MKSREKLLEARPKSRETTARPQGPFGSESIVPLRHAMPDQAIKMQVGLPKSTDCTAATPGNPWLSSSKTATLLES